MFLRFNLILINFETCCQIRSPIVGTFYLRTHYHSGTSIYIQYYFADEQVKHPCKKEGGIFFENKTILTYTDPKQLLTIDFYI